MNSHTASPFYWRTSSFFLAFLASLLVFGVTCVDGAQLRRLDESFILKNGRTVDCAWAKKFVQDRCPKRCADGTIVRQKCPDICAGEDLRDKEEEEKKEEDTDGPIDERQSANPETPQEGQSNGVGVWGEEFDMEVIPIHSMVLPDGQILSYGTDNKGKQRADLYYEVWNLNEGFHGYVHKLLRHRTKTDLFCSTMNVDVSSGNIIIMGGDKRPDDPDVENLGINAVMEYDVKTEQIYPHPKGKMKYARWYGSSVNLPNGDIFIVGGMNGNKKGSAIPEVYSPESGFRALRDARVPSIASGGKTSFWWYPHTYVNSNGDIIVFTPRGKNADVYHVVTEGNGDIHRIGEVPFGVGKLDTRNASIMFRTDRVAFLDQDGDLYVADISTSTSVSWEKVNSIGFSRTNGSLVMLPNGKVAMVGGAKNRDKGYEDANVKDAVKYIQIWDPEENTIERGDREEQVRLYHSSALMLPKGVLISMGGGAPGPRDGLDGQIYHPDYLFDANQEEAERPVIVECPRNIESGETFSIKVEDASRIVKVTATKSGMSSHSRNFETRWLDLEFDVQDASSLVVKAENRNVMICGLWMVNLIDINGVPSEASLMGVNMADLP